MSANWKRLSVSLALTIFLCALPAQVKELVVLHSNDTHSQIEPNSLSASRDAGQGGIVRREAAIEQVRKQNSNVLLVDAGDFVQGSPYFNFFGGEVEIQMMNKMGYEVGTLGNHEFDNGLEALAKILAQAQFPFVCSNYDVSATPLAPYVKKDSDSQ
jgi:5''-nucleotidase/2'',3''-cyclic phosphodiesterase and related esterases